MKPRHCYEHGQDAARLLLARGSGKSQNIDTGQWVSAMFSQSEV